MLMITKVGGEWSLRTARPRAGPTLWSPVHHTSSPHLRIGHTSITLSQDNFLRQPSNVLIKTMNSHLDHLHQSAKTGLLAMIVGIILVLTSPTL